MGIDLPPQVDICMICVHYEGTELFFMGEDFEEDHRNICKAFPEGIPELILLGKSKHRKPFQEQKNNIVFEKK